MYDFIERVKSLFVRKPSSPPKTTSALLRLALADLAKAEANPRFRVEMSEWLTPIDSQTCYVCLAGSVMACTLECDPTKLTYPTQDVVGGWTGALLALNELRRGEITDAYDELNRAIPDGVPSHIHVVPYHRNPTAWREDMNALADLLEKAGD